MFHHHFPILNIQFSIFNFLLLSSPMRGRGRRKHPGYIRLCQSLPAPVLLRPSPEGMPSAQAESLGLCLWRTDRTYRQNRECRSSRCEDRTGRRGQWMMDSQFL